MRETIRILNELRKRESNEIVSKGLGCGPTDCKIKRGADAGTVCMTIYYILHDLAIDLHVPRFDKDKLRKELSA